MSTSSQPTILERTLGFWRDQIVVFVIALIGFGTIGLVSAGVFSFIAPELARLVVYPVLGSSLFTAVLASTLEDAEDATSNVTGEGLVVAFLFIFVVVRFAPLYLATVAAGTTVGDWSLFLLVFMPAVDGALATWRWYLSPFVWPMVVLLGFFHAVGYLNEVTLESVLSTSSFGGIY